VRVLTRSPQSAGQFAWDPAAGSIDERALQNANYVINLAGAGIADRRWTKARKQTLIDSRVQSALTLYNAFERIQTLPNAYLSASAVGYYGDSGERLMTETDSTADSGFLPECCRQWEQAADTVSTLGIRTVKLRIGVVLSKKGGALPEFIKPLRFGIGTYFSDGKAWYPWIHLDDVCHFFIWALENPQAEGVFNVAAPAPVRNKELIRAIAKAMQQPALPTPIPAFALRLALGEMAAVVLSSNRIAADKALQSGFRFLYPDLEDALRDIFQNNLV
jgi:hypothetical protein